MSNTIAGKKGKSSDSDGVPCRPRYPYMAMSGCSASPSDAQRTRSLRGHSGLCERCAGLDLDKILSKPQKTIRGGLVAKLAPVSKWSINSCSFCNLLSSTLYPGSFKPRAKHSLYSYSSNRIPDFGWNSINKTILQILGSDVYIVPQAVGAKGPIRLLKPNSIDFEILKGWISVCRVSHTKLCTVEAPYVVPFLKIIDCETRKIVPAVNEPYVALSYIWGQIVPPSISDSGFLPKDLPPTIEDSINVTLRLGFQYLWIDRCCINQQFSEEVDAQVQIMDLIYQNAEVTIIACAGEDPTYGLPGIGNRKRRPQASGRVGKHLMVSALSDPRRSIKFSKWSTRPWTYQEGLLSRRRLFFTDEQVYYECHGMYCCEAMDFPLLDLHSKNRQRFRKIVCRGEDIGKFPKGVGRSPWEVVERIEQYSRLSVNLREPSDILKGILGILNAFKRSNYKIHHYGGIPLLPLCPKVVEFPTDNWTATKGFISGLCWALENPSFRRAGFPSWSWTGWNGPIVWGYENSIWKYIRVDNNVQVSAELADGGTLNWEGFHESQSTPKLASGLTNFIHVTAWTSSLQIIMRQNTQKLPGEYEAKIQLEDGGYINWRFKATTIVPLLPDQLVTGIHLVHEVSANYHHGAMGPALVVVGQVGGVIERIGFGWVDQHKYERFDKNGGVAKDGIAFWTKAEFLSPLRLMKSWQRIRLG